MTITLPSGLVLGRARDGALARRALLPVEALECAGRAGAGAQSGYRASRLAAKRALQRLVGSVERDRIAVVRAAYARAPVASTRTGAGGALTPLPVSLSLSHSGDRGVAVAAPARLRVGVDLERRGAVPPAVERFFLSLRERDALAALDATSLWCLKEAAWKAVGATPALPLNELELQFADGQLIGVTMPGAQYAARGALFSPWRGWIGAVVWREQAP